MSDENSFPLLPLRDVVVFPHMMVPLFVGREKSITALNEVMKTKVMGQAEAEQSCGRKQRPKPNMVAGKGGGVAARDGGSSTERGTLK